ncbi:cupredoxin domain-containing protein [Crocosphaera sp. XPORK-15E]|uniref:cupredoxin domain-containing protein n=1 Tax=Crocosphaera sp. XPORK-15E TaxID=3110247 RepID=UPI003A4D4579
MKRFKKIQQFCGFVFSILLMCCLMNVSDTLAATDMTEVKVSLGNAGGELIFVPNHLEFTAGKKYKILLDNPSPIKHYFTSKDFADASWTQNVKAGNVEIKGAIHELELKPAAEAQWNLVPMKPGKYELHCSIPGHKEAGMIGEIVVLSE